MDDEALPSPMRMREAADTMWGQRHRWTRTTANCFGPGHSGATGWGTNMAKSRNHTMHNQF